MCGKYWQYKSPGPPAGPPISLFVGKLDTRLLHLLFSLSFFLLLSPFNHSSHTWLLLSLFLFPSSIRLYLAFLFPVRSSIPFTFIVSTSINLLVPLPATVRRAIRLYPSFSTAIVPTTFNHLHFSPNLRPSLVPPYSSFSWPVLEDSSPRSLPIPAQPRESTPPRSPPTNLCNYAILPRLSSRLAWYQVAGTTDEIIAASRNTTITCLLQFSTYVDVDRASSLLCFFRYVMPEWNATVWYFIRIRRMRSWTM